MLTEFGQYLRKIRIDCGDLLKDMADKLGVTSSYLSAVETGKRNVPALRQAVFSTGCWRGP
jgi:transcriptional regulator with XRE-family HTH domain